MTRKEEIKQAATAYAEKWYREHYIHTEDFPTDVAISKGDFVAGAEWADKTLIEKACRWLSSVRLDYYADKTEECITDFKKAMEE